MKKGQKSSTKKFIWEKFWPKVDKRGPKECWNWTGAKNEWGYGLIWVGHARGKGKTMRAHRWSWEQLHGPIMGDAILCHRCDNPSCVNPHHMFLGTHAENGEDRMAKGRNGIRRKDVPPEKLNEIRADSADGLTYKMIALKHGVCISTVQRVVKHKTRAEEPEEALSEECRKATDV